MKCTWKDCNKEAEKPLFSKNGTEWANLCSEHFDKHEDGVVTAIKKGGKDNLKRMLSNHIKAQGGASGAAKRLLGG